MSGLGLGRVVAVHPEDRSVDLVMIPDGARLAGVQVLSGVVSSNSGLADLHEPVGTGGEKWTLATEGEREIIACVGYVGRNPLVVGFLAPQVCEVLFARKNFRIDRHASDVYQTIDDAGNVELYHPSGTFLRIAESPDHEDLTGQDFDKAFKVTRNTSKAVHVRLQVKNAGVLKATVSIDPSGNVGVTHEGDLAVDTGGAMAFTAGGGVSIGAGGPVAITSPSLSHNGKNVGHTHTHGGITPGGASTAPPD